MSSSIWTRCAGDSKVAPLRLAARRVVESQHQISTRKLVDSMEEHEVLERLIDAAKPDCVAPSNLHYLLTTPFRYPPLPHGSRFASRFEPSLWYGSENLPTAFAEVAFHRFAFLNDTDADLAPLKTSLTAFAVRVNTRAGVDLTRKPFAALRSAISAPTHYQSSQALGRAMRIAGVEAFRYPSARDPCGGNNVGVFQARAFGRAQPRDFTHWHSVVTRDRVEIVKRDFVAPQRLAFDLEEFLLRGELPNPVK